MGLARAPRPSPAPLRARGFDPPDLRGLRVLIVQSESDVPAELRERLESYGARVDLASTCSEARGKVVTSDYDLLVTDVALADGSGYALARFAQALARPPACIAVSARGEDEVEQARRVGFRLHLRKPCDPAVLARVAEQFRPTA